MVFSLYFQIIRFQIIIISNEFIMNNPLVTLDFVKVMKYLNKKMNQTVAPTDRQRHLIFKFLKFYYIPFHSGFESIAPVDVIIWTNLKKLQV